MNVRYKSHRQMMRRKQDYQIGFTLFAILAILLFVGWISSTENEDRYRYCVEQHERSGMSDIGKLEAIIECSRKTGFVPVKELLMR